MKKDVTVYKFYDTDKEGLKEYDISGKNYEELMKACCKFSKFFSVIVADDSLNLISELKKYEIEKEESIIFCYDHYVEPKIKYFEVCDGLCETILAHTDSIFCWINGWNSKNPEDPAFYREDGTVFFSSTIHDGECTLSIRDEDISLIVNKDNWVRID